AVRAFAGVGMVDAAGIVSAGAEAETRAFVTAGKTQAALPSIAAAIAQAQAGIEPFATGAASEYLYHAANGVGAIDRRAWAAQYLDTLDLFDIQVFQRRAASGSRAYPLAIHQHEA